MELWFVLIVTLFLLRSSVCQVKFCDKSCAKNEVFSNRVSQCQSTCFNQNFEQSSGCLINPGCVCKQGFIRNQDTYNCIPTATCVDKRGSKQCPSNEFWSDCDGACQRTCQNRKSTLRCRCVSGCVCRTGYIRSDINFQCILEGYCDRCPVGYVLDQATKTCIMDCRKCNTNEVYKSCGTQCEPTCTSPTDNSCSQACVEGCFCVQGYVRMTTNGSCVPIKNCGNSASSSSSNSRCPENSIYSCGNPLCETTCQTLGQTCTNFPIRCENKCYCSSGFVRALAGGQCVSAKQCPIINRQRNQSIRRN